MNQSAKAANLDDPSQNIPMRITLGDRDAAAAFLETNGDLIRRRLRHKLGRAMRRIFDSQDLMSTLARRLDHYVDAGRADVGTEAQLWRLVLQIAEHAIIDKARLMDRIQRAEGPDSDFANRFRSRMLLEESRSPEGSDELIARILDGTPDPLDREILTLWCNGRSLSNIAMALGSSPDMVRKRWQRVRERSQSLMMEEAVP